MSQAGFVDHLIDLAFPGAGRANVIVRMPVTERKELFLFARVTR
jgi:hypothetical protein